MLKEIHEQPDAVAETIADRVAHDSVELTELDELGDLPTRLRRIVIVACGTSYHAGLVGRYAIEQWARIPVEMDIASEYRYRDPVVSDDDLVIGITQSGETADTLAAMRLARERGATVLALTNVMGSQATRDADAVLFTRAGIEICGRGDQDLREPGGGDVPDRHLARAAPRDARRAAPRRADRAAQGAAPPDPRDARRRRRAGSRRGLGLRGPSLLPLSRPQHRPAGVPRGRPEAEGDLLHPDRRLRGR